MSFMRRETRPLALGMLVQFRGSRLMGPAGLLPAMRAVALRLRRRGGDLHSIAVMIKAIVTRVLAPALGQWPGRLHWPRLLQLLAAARWASAMSSLARSQAPAPTLISFGGRQ
jgi:hypothetical protein